MSPLPLPPPLFSCKLNIHKAIYMFWSSLTHNLRRASFLPLKLEVWELKYFLNISQCSLFIPTSETDLVMPAKPWEDDDDDDGDDCTMAGLAAACPYLRWCAEPERPSCFHCKVSWRCLCSCAILLLRESCAQPGFLAESDSSGVYGAVRQQQGWFELAQGCRAVYSCMHMCLYVCVCDYLNSPLVAKSVIWRFLCVEGEHGAVLGFKYQLSSGYGSAPAC